MDTAWHSEDINTLLRVMESRTGGLSSKEATERIALHGPNSLPEPKHQSLFGIFLDQFKNPLIYVLLAAGSVIYLAGDEADAIVVFSVLLFNAVMGTIQEGRANNALRALRKFSETSATVLRDGAELVVPDTEIVPGDIIIVRGGEKVPADARIISAHTLLVNESAITGEAQAVTKNSEILSRANLPLGDRKNMLFKGTNALTGSCTALVLATGTKTVLGTISESLTQDQTEIPLKTAIRELSQQILTLVAICASSLFVIGVILGKAPLEMLGVVLSLSISLIPEGLPVVITLVLATGVHRMAKKNAIVKKLPAVEALGQADIIAIDKTGTLTRNEMMVRRVFAGGTEYTVTGNGYEPTGEILHENKNLKLTEAPAPLLQAGKIGAFSPNVGIAMDHTEQKYKISGDPTEAALVVFGHKLGFIRPGGPGESSRVAELPFDLAYRYHASLDPEGEGYLVSTSGAPEAIISACTEIIDTNGIRKLTEEDKRSLEARVGEFADFGLRAIASAYKITSKKTLEHGDISNLVLVALFGIEDAIRKEAPEAIERAHSAGAQVVMITGDQIRTAVAIAKQAGLRHDTASCIDGSEIDLLDDTELAQRVAHTTIFARVAPQQKLRIIKAFQANGNIVAMTGDGVNDAPSLVVANLGVAMGKIGTEVAKDSADIVLVDDNFGTIVTAMEEGRNIYRTVQKVISYLFSTNLGELLTITVAVFLGLPLPLLAGQIIWLNLVTDGFLDVALAMEPKESGLLTARFRRGERQLVTRAMVQRIITLAIPMAIGTLILFSIYTAENSPKALTISLTTLAVFQWFSAWSSRSERLSLFQMNPFGNPYLIGATIIVILLQVFALHNGVMQKLLRTTPLSLTEWALIISICTSLLLVDEIRKAFVRRKTPATNPAVEA